MRICIVTVFIFISVSHLHGQIPNWEEVEVNENYSLESLTIDSLGFLWALSKDALFKYDGYDIVEINRPKIPNEKYLSLGGDQDGNLLLGTNRGVVQVYNPYLASIIDEIKFFDSLPVTNISCDDIDNECLVLSYGKTLSTHWGAIKENVSQENLLISNEIYDFQVNANEIIIASDQGIQVLKSKDGNLQNETYSEQKLLLDVITTNILDTERGRWISYFADSITLISSDTVKHFYFPKLGKISDLKYHDHSLYISSENGLFELTTNVLVQKYPLEGRMSVKDFCFDRQGNVWIINGKRKLLKGNLLFQKFRKRIPQIQALVEVGKKIWIGNKDGLFTFQNDQQKQILPKNITSIIYHHDLLWVGTFSDGFYILDETGKIMLHQKGWNGFENQSILTMLIEQDKLFVSSLTGVSRMKLKISSGQPHISEIESLNDKIGEGYYYQIIKEGGRYFFAKDGEGIVMMDSSGITPISKFQNGLEIGSVYSLTADDMGVIWFSSSAHGLGYYSEGKAFRRRQKKNSFDNYTALKRLEDGNILMIRTESIDILNPISNKVIYYDEVVGITDEPPFLNSASVTGPRVIFSHNDFVYQYKNPGLIKFDPKILINSVVATFDTISNNAVLPQNQNNIQIKYTGSWLTNPNKVTYQYKLEGLDNLWRETKDRTVSFPKLSPGNYEFLLRASVNDTYINNSTQKFNFKIKRHFFNTWWFYTLIAILLITLIIKWRDQKKKRLLEQVETEKKQVESQLINLKNQLNPHFLFNSFNTLMGLIEEDQDRSLAFVEKLTDFYRSVLVHGKDQLIPLDKEIYLVSLFVDILNERFDQALEINLPKPNEDLLIPPLTLQLLIENAVKHNEIGQEKKLVIDIIYEGNYLVIKNKLAPKMYSVKSTGSGLDNIKKRFLLLNSKAVLVTKTKDTFEVRLPLIRISDQK